MSAFEGVVLEQTIAVAQKHQIEPAALLAVVEVESAGKSLEMDGRTPCFLFERHVFYRALKKSGRLSALRKAVDQGLANEKWQPATQYKDQGSSRARLDLFRRAAQVDMECACQACSWGVGQVLGENYKEVGFQSALLLYTYMTNGGVPAQVECMIREIEHKGLKAKLNLHDWAGFARVYNGSGYKRNQYDTKMAAAYLKWRSMKLPTVTSTPDVAPATPPAPTNDAKKGGSWVVPTVGTGGIVGGGFLVDYKGGLILLAVVAILVVITLIVVKRRKGQTTPAGNLPTTDPSLRQPVTL